MQAPGRARVRNSEPLRATECTHPSTAFAQDSSNVAQIRPTCFQVVFLHFKKGRPNLACFIGSGEKMAYLPRIIDAAQAPWFKDGLIGALTFYPERDCIIKSHSAYF